MSTFFQIISDLHLESQPSYTDFKFSQTAPNLALLGDIGHVKSDQLFTFLQLQLKRYDKVFYLFGNNEPFGLSLAAAKQRIMAFASDMDHLKTKSKTYGEFVFLDQTRYDLGQITILGCTLFSNILPEQANAVGARMGDFRGINSWSIGRHNEAHLSDLTWLNEQVRGISSLVDPQRRIVIFTHHSPTLAEQASNPKHRGSDITSGFATDLRGEQCWQSTSVSLWSFGHTHYDCDFHDNGKRIFANQRGSILSPQSTFDSSKVVQL